MILPKRRTNQTIQSAQTLARIYLLQPTRRLSLCLVGSKLRVSGVRMGPSPSSGRVAFASGAWASYRVGLRGFKGF